MTNKKLKKPDKREIPLRPRGEVIAPVERPSKTLFDAVLKAEQDDLSATNPPGTTDQLPAAAVPPAKQLPTSPANNFTKVPNSVTSNAIPQGLFKGLSKHTYDVLYKLTRGAIKPARTVQLTRMELMKSTGLSENTQRVHIKYLSLVGLVKVSYQTGKHEGATYEVFVPEELDPSQVLPSTTNQYQVLPSGTNPYQLLGGHKYQKLVGVGTTQSQQNIGQNDDPKTSFKTNTYDDERSQAFSRFIEVLDDASKKLTGKAISKREADKWEALADLLVLELEVAAARAQGVSSVPAFLTEVLRRQFFNARTQKTEKPPSAKTSNVKPDTVGKSDSDNFEIKPLDEQGREAALEQLGEFAGESFLEDFKKWYTADDWQWLIENLKAATNNSD